LGGEKKKVRGWKHPETFGKVGAGRETLGGWAAGTNHKIWQFLSVSGRKYREGYSLSNGDASAWLKKGKEGEPEGLQPFKRIESVGSKVLGLVKQGWHGKWDQRCRMRPWRIGTS